MGKNITIGILALVTFLSLVYASFQVVAANKSRVQAEQNLVLAEEVRKQAEANAAEAVKQRQLMEEILKKCQEGK
jgi:hypothetical protein